MAATIGLVLDCADPDRLAAFWSAALGYATLGGAGSYVMLIDQSGQQPKVLPQRVPEAKTGKNRMRLDIETPAVDARSCDSKTSAPAGSRPNPEPSMGPDG